MQNSNSPWFSRCLAEIGSSRWFGLCLLPLALVMAVGCSGKGPKNSITGKVTIQGDDKPVNGTVYFVYADNKEVSSPIKADGTYQIDKATPGKIKVVVKSMQAGTGPTVAPPPPMKDAPKMPEMPGSSGVAPPAKYAAASTSDIEYEVQEGVHTFDIQLKP